MRRGSLPGSLSLFAVLLLAACAGPHTVQTPQGAVVVTADARALQYGATAPEVLNNPRLAYQLQALFGADWNPNASRLYGAPAYFPDFSSIRMVRIAGREYIGISGCVPTACGTNRGVLLIGGDNQLAARLDDGGFSHYYDYGPAPGSLLSHSIIDGAWYALTPLDRR